MSHPLLRILLSLILAVYMTPMPSMMAQQVNSSVVVQQTASHADAATIYSGVEGSATAASTLTMTPNGGEYVYIYEVDITNVVGATAVSATTTSTITTTNISGSPLWVMVSGVTAGTTSQVVTAVFDTGLKSQTPGTAVTLVLPQLKINQGLHANVAWRSAP